jgi:hypothetical protein
VQAGRAVGAQTVLLAAAPAAGAAAADLVAPSLLAAVDLLLGGEAGTAAVRPGAAR